MSDLSFLDGVLALDTRAARIQNRPRDFLSSNDNHMTKPQPPWAPRKSARSAVAFSGAKTS